MVSRGNFEIDEECGYLQDLLGAAFVVGQRYITRVLSWVGGLQRLAQKDGGAPRAVPGKKGKRHFFASYGPSVAGGTVCLPWPSTAGRTFFKHESEWQGNWECLDGQQGQTYDDLRNLGVKQGSTGNMRAIAGAQNHVS